MISTRPAAALIRPMSYLTLMIVTVLACARDAPEKMTSTVVALENGQWYTGDAFEARTVYMDSGVFLAYRPSAVDSTVDLQGGFVIPPFGDAHTHNLDGLFNLEEITAAYVQEGTFYVSVLTNTASGAAAASPVFDGSCSLDVTYAHGGLTSTLSHPFLAYEPRAMGLYADWEPHAAAIRESRLREDDAYWFIDRIDDLDRKWPGIVGADPDIIKIFLLEAQEDHPAMPDTGLPHGHGLRPSLVPEIVRRADAVGLRVAAHVETASDFSVAVNAGVHIVAHMPGYLFGSDPDGGFHLDVSPAPFEIPEAVASQAGRNRIVMTPTVAWTYVASGPDSTEIVRRRHALMRRNLERLQKGGVQIVVGSDWFGETAWHEIEAMRALAAWDESELLKMWAVETPRVVFPDRRIGKLAAGYEASFLVLEANPLIEFDSVRRIRLRVKQGCFLSS